MDRDPVTWLDVSRWAAVIATVVVASFWLAKIDMAIAAVQHDVTEIKVGLREHVKLPSHPVAAVRLNALEKR
tara:strand:+ start:141 stop:356 length:216 start_codon:yes stop_codon:yes gene_type:complete